MQMNLPTEPTQGPSLGEPETSGSAAGLIPRNLSRDSGSSDGPAMSVKTAERSRSCPAESSRPGFSAPGFPNRSSFILSSSFLIIQCRNAQDLSTLPAHDLLHRLT